MSTGRRSRSGVTQEIKQLDEINERYKRENRLHSVMIELTHACPSDCEHCFLNRDTRDELSCEEIADLLGQLAAEGTFNLGLTGGESMARRDFPRILEEVAKHNFFVSLLTTAVMIKQPEVGLAASLDCQYAANVSVVTKADGNPAPLAYALSEDELATVNPKYLNGGILPDENFQGGAILVCRAGTTVAGISPRGDVFPCTLLPKVVGNIRQNTLHEIWHENPDPMLIQMRNLREEDSAECYACELKSYCRRCPGIAYMETGSPIQKCDSKCTSAKGIRAALEGTFQLGQTPAQQKFNGR